MRSKGGRETWRRLLDWDRAQSDSERLAGHILRFEGFVSIDPSHPLGGPDGLKDIVCKRGGKKWIGAAYFPRGQQDFTKISTKMKADLQGVTENSVDGLSFVTNQEMSLGEREALKSLGSNQSVDVFHLERLTSILDSTEMYGLRLDFLDIEMTKEEQLAFVAQRDQVLSQMKLTLDALVESLSDRPQSRAQAEMPIVSPRNLPSVAYSLTGGVPEPRHCSSCNSIFLVDRSQSATSISAFSLTGMTIVSCPFCGHTERFNPWPF